MSKSLLTSLFIDDWNVFFQIAHWLPVNSPQFHISSHFIPLVFVLWKIWITMTHSDLLYYMYLLENLHKYSPILPVTRVHQKSANQSVHATMQTTIWVWWCWDICVHLCPSFIIHKDMYKKDSYCHSWWELH